MCLVHRVGCWALAIRRAPLLSIYNVVASSCGTLILSRMDLIYKIDFPASHAAVNSASVELNAIVSWNLVL